MGSSCKHMPLGRREFVCKAAMASFALLSVGLAPPGCVGAEVQPASEAEGSSSAAPVTATRIEPRGGSDYPLADASTYTFADPLVEDIDFEPLVIEEAGGTRVATPFYSMFVPNDMFPDGWNIDYSGYVRDWSGEYSGGLWMGHGLTIFHPDRSGSSTSLNVRVVSTSWDGIQGELVAISVGPAPGNSMFHTVVHGPADYTGDRTGAQARKKLAPYADLVSPEIVAAQDESGTWRIVKVPQLQPTVSEVDGRTEVSTPWYTVALEADMWQNGCAYRYNGRTDPPPSDGIGGGSTSCYLELYDTLTRDLRGIVCLREGGAVEPGRTDGFYNFYAWRDLGPSEADPSRNVLAIVPTGNGLRPGDDGDFGALAEAARPNLDRMAVCVSTAG